MGKQSKTTCRASGLITPPKEGKNNLSEQTKFIFNAQSTIKHFAHPIEQKETKETEDVYM